MNFMKNLRQKDSVEEPMSTANDVAFGAKGFNPEATTLINVDKMHLYSNVVGATDPYNVSSSFGSY